MDGMRQDSPDTIRGTSDNDPSSPRSSKGSPDHNSPVDAKLTPVHYSNDTSFKTFDTEVNSELVNDSGEESMSDQGRRRLHSQSSSSSSSRRPSSRGSHASQQPHSQQTPPLNPPLEANRNPSFQPGSSHPFIPSTQPSYPQPQHGSYVGQYMMPQQLPPLSMGHTTSFAYSHPFHMQGSMVDAPMMQQPPIHASYQHQQQQPHNPVYQYAPESGSSQHHPFTGGPSPAVYGRQQNSVPHTSVSSPPLSSPPYVTAAQQFQSLGYTSVPSAQYSYPALATPTSMCPPQYPATSYPQHYQQSQEQEGQGTWWFSPYPAQSFDTSQQGYYPTIGYSQPRSQPMLHQTVDAPYSQASVGPLSPTVHTSSYGMSASSSWTTVPASIPSSSHFPPPALSPEQPSPSSSKPHTVANDKAVVRRAYHPNPPAHRSEWVMWSGNVPADAAHDELWWFFNNSSPPPASQRPPPSPATSADETLSGGVLSIFLISRSSCAFVNFETEAHLHAAITRFNGQPLRPNDSRCPRLLCRERRKDDDLKAGVGGQRGMGMHTRWVKDKEKKPAGEAPSLSTDSRLTVSDMSSSASGSSDNVIGRTSALSLSSDEDTQHLGLGPKTNNSTSSYASTTSSILARHFPKRYFILKSLTQFDLDLSVEKGLWATQRHNEGILDQAYRTSKDVFLIFGVNKSGEFYGYAKMAGPVLRGEHRVSWATRAGDSGSSSRSSLSSVMKRASAVLSDPIPEEHPSGGGLTTNTDDTPYFSPSENRPVDESPMPQSGISPAESSIHRPSLGPLAPQLGHIPRPAASAPAILGPTHRGVTTSSQSPVKQSSDYYTRVAVSKLAASEASEFQLDPDAPSSAASMRGGTDSSGISSGSKNPLESVTEEGQSGTDASGELAGEAPTGEAKGKGRARTSEGGEDRAKRPGGDGEEPQDDGWGESFKIEWLCTDKLPFFRTRHLRNPWNHDREVKVSRDGTELEPAVGQRLLDEWESLAEPQTGPSPPPGSRRGHSQPKMSTTSRS